MTNIIGPVVVGIILYLIPAILAWIGKRAFYKDWTKPPGISDVIQVVCPILNIYCALNHGDYIKQGMDVLNTSRFFMLKKVKK